MPMSRKQGMPSASMKRSYGVLTRPHLPKPARSPVLGSCQWVFVATSCIVFFRLWNGFEARIAIVADPSTTHALDCEGRLTEGVFPLVSAHVGTSSRELPGQPYGEVPRHYGS